MTKFKLSDVKYKHLVSISLILFIIAYLCALSKIQVLSNSLFGIAIITFCASTILFIKTMSIKNKVQVLIVLFIVTLFWDLTVLNSDVALVHKKLMIIGLLSLNGSLIYILVSIRKMKLYNYFLDWILNHKELIVIITIFIFLNFPLLSSLFRSDSLTYYRAILDSKNTWDFTLNNTSVFFLCGHNTFSVSIIYFIGEYLIPESGIGLRVILMIMSSITIIAFEDILSYLFKNINKSLRLILISIFAFSPLFFGLFYELGTDFPMMCFFILFIWAKVRNYKVFELFFMVSCCFAKEIGIVLCALYLCGEIIFKIITSKNIVKSLFNYYNILYLLVPIFFVMGFFQKSSWLSKFTNNSEVVNDVVDSTFIKANSIAFNWDYIFNKANELFIIHFQWLLVLLIILCIIISFIKGRKKDNYNNTYVLSISCSFIGFLGFNFFFITYLNYRYVQTMIFFIIYFLAECFNRTRISEKVLKGLSITSLILISIESYYTIDPITKQTLNTINIGSTELVHTKTFIKINPNYFVSSKESDEVYNFVLLDGASTNRQITGLENVLENALASINYKEEDVLVIPIIFKDDTTTMYNIFGNNQIRNLMWDSERENISYNENDTIIKFISSIDYVSSINLDENLNYYYFDFHIGDYDKNPAILNETMNEKLSFHSYGWHLDVYRLK